MFAVQNVVCVTLLFSTLYAEPACAPMLGAYMQLSLHRPLGLWQQKLSRRKGNRSNRWD